MTTIPRTRQTTGARIAFVVLAGLLMVVQGGSSPWVLGLRADHAVAGELAPQPSTGSAGAAVAAAVRGADLPQGCTEPNRHLTLYAVELPRVDGDIRLGYGVTPESASYPGPTIEMIEGECLAITLVNDVPAATLAELRDHPRLGLVHPDPDYPLGVSLHVHGVRYTQASDGTMHSGSWVPPGESRTYVWYAEPRVVAADGRVVSHGTAGAWWYHDHVAGTDHGTGGIGSGLFGGLVVRRPGDVLPDRTYVLAMGDDSTINLRRGSHSDTCDHADPQPSSTCLVARQGERVEFVVFGIGNDFHTFHMHGHTWVDDRHGILTPTEVDTRIVDVIPLGPSASFGFQIVAGNVVGEGEWMIHCHVQRHSDLGMFTSLHVLPAEAPLVDPASLDTDQAAAVPATAALHAGARFRGTGSLPAATPADPTLGYYCRLPLDGGQSIRPQAEFGRRSA